jgi:hypothetical protein
MTFLFAIFTLSLCSLSLQQCGVDDVTASAACTDNFTACTDDVVKNREMFQNACHCYKAYIRCSVEIPCIQMSGFYQGYLDICNKNCAPCDWNSTTPGAVTSSVYNSIVTQATTNVVVVVASSSSSSSSDAVVRSNTEAQNDSDSAGASATSIAMTVIIGAFVMMIHDL